MKKLSVIFGLMLLCALAFAGESTITKPADNFTGTLTVTQKADVNSTSLGNTITFTISIMNPGSGMVSAYVEQGLGNVDPVSPMPTYSNLSGDVYAARSPYLSWTVDIASGETYDLSYQVRPKTVGPLSIGPAAVWVGNKVFYSNGLMIQVECSNSSSCDGTIGENPLTCPSKCAAANATGNTTPDFQPVLIPTDPIPVPDASANLQEIQDEEKKLTDEVNNSRMMWGGGVLLVIVLIVAAYFLFFRKKGPKYEKGN